MLLEFTWELLGEALGLPGGLPEKALRAALETRGAILAGQASESKTEASDIKTHAHQRGNASDGELTAMASPDPVAEVQIRKLYHDDVALHRMVCGGGRKTYREFTGAYLRALTSN